MRPSELRNRLIGATRTERGLATLVVGGGMLVATIVVEVLSVLHGLAPPDPNIWRIGLGVPALCVAAATFYLGPRLSERNFARSHALVMLIAIAYGCILLAITPATFAVYFELALFALVGAFFATRTVLLTELILLSVTAFLPAVFPLAGHVQAQVPPWLIVFLPTMWGVSWIVFVRRADVNRALAAVRAQGLLDPLTGLSNLRCLTGVVEARPAGESGGLLLLDLDDFKIANTLYGHLGGDQALRVVADALREVAPAHHLVARIGGDEIAVFAPGADGPQLEQLAVTYREAVRNANKALALPGVHLDASVGNAQYPRDGVTLGDLLTAADLSMYAVKATRARRRADILVPQATDSTRSFVTGCEPQSLRRGFDDPLRAHAALLALASAMILFSLIPGGAPHTNVLAIVTGCAVGFAIAAVLALAPSGWRVVARFPSDLVFVALLILMVYWTGGAHSQAIGLATLVVLVQSVGSRTHGLLWRFAVPAVVVLSPLAYQDVLGAGQGPRTIATLTACLAFVEVVVAQMVGTEAMMKGLTDTATDLASTDPLTGLANRRAFNQAVELALANSDARFTLVMIDLDNFGDVNTFHGHQAGDDLLRDVARVLSDAMRDHDCIARVGGDEFAAILGGVDGAGARTITERLVLAVKECTGRFDDQIRVAVTASAGYAVFPEHGKSLDALMARSDEALMAVKSAGKGAVAAGLADDAAALSAHRLR